MSQAHEHHPVVDEYMMSPLTVYISERVIEGLARP